MEEEEEEKEADLPPIETLDKGKGKDIHKEVTMKDQPPFVDASAKPYIPKAPFPQRLQENKNKEKNEGILEVFKNVHINIPFLDAIQQVPSYAKFLKDLITIKRRKNVPKKAFLTEQVSSIIQSRIPIKYKDPGCPTVTCRIGEHHIERALLDLGASMNLLPYSVYMQLGLGELKSTPITL